MVVVFADLAGFTALTEAHGDEEAVEVVDAFEEIVRSAADEHGLRLVKNIGDAFMLCGEHPNKALAACLQIAARVAQLESAPGVRIGVHTGEIVERGDDLFGNTVNLAARVAAEATSGQILVTRSILSETELSDDIRPRSAGARVLKNLKEPIELFDVSLESVAKELDPVCRMMLTPESATASLRHQHRTYYFCSSDCLKRFLNDLD